MGAVLGGAAMILTPTSRSSHRQPGHLAAQLSAISKRLKRGQLVIAIGNPLVSSPRSPPA